MARGATAQRVVGFATEVTSIRPAKDDEQSVMEHFARHASKCNICKDPYLAYKQDTPLCDRGNAYAIDVANYIYSKGGKPFSVIDRKRGDRVQIEIPFGCEVISSLVKAFDRGMTLRASKPVVVTPTFERERLERADKTERPSSYSPRTERRKEYHVEDQPRERRYRQGDVEMVEITPSTARRERREQVYRDRVDEQYRPERRARPLSYMERKGSLYERDEQEKRQRRRYEEQPIVIVAEPPRRHVRR
ncbi:hypothetical protein A1O3_02567 [Capronia epimyces CBS 606.96]|uniref:Uncharacterized protein n=1 Tax=Capronia epimyces CBS 606.96 TaxID=1182542 RepID=W9YIK5_9EURO|nr:uncharacterized protein A1O3_02567 [Capronia epimyces CBS 606.96]EXJ89500.1 hypothetical protein A1O3_02567 [Capronia epimyces CBS 606.96]